MTEPTEPTANDVAMWVAHELSEVLDDSSGLYPAGVQIIAAALTAEREKARAPFLALAEELTAVAPGELMPVNYAAVEIRRASEETP